jgi:type IV secretory pathway VirD2 relaxase
MTSSDDEFRVRLGRIGHRANRKVASFAKRVRKAAEKAGAQRSGRSSAFTGSRIGRGRAFGGVLLARIGGARRVVVKARIVRIKRGELGAARAHLRYVQRDGVTRDGQSGKLYEANNDRADGQAFAARGAEDGHQFRFIVAPEDSAEMADLKPFVRDLMRQMETDLGTKLDWVAADHFNTGHPHSHIIVRGKDDRGDDLVIARDYISHGLRARASELVTRELGPESELDSLRKLEHDVEAERFTRLDRAILRDSRDGSLTAAGMPGREPRLHAIRMGRLRVLERMGLATETAAGTWQLDAELEPTLRRMGERGDIIKTMHRDLAAAGLKRAAADQVMFDASEPGGRIVGRVVAEGISDELSDRRYAVVDGVDGRTYYADLGVRGIEDEMLSHGAIVEIKAHDVAPRAIDQTIAEVAGRNDRIYSAPAHRKFDPAASEEYIAAHARRLEAMRRDGRAERLPDGGWPIADDHLQQAAAFEANNRLKNPVRITMLSWQELESLPKAAGATWLDKELVGATPEVVGATGFGAEVRSALQARRQWLLQQGLAREQAGQMIYARNLLQTLQRRELGEVAARIARETGLNHVEIKRGDRLSGTYRRMLTLSSGRYALIERARDFALVPWRPVLERARGQLVTGSVGGEGISWSIGIKRGMGR